MTRAEAIDNLVSGLVSMERGKDNPETGEPMIDGYPLYSGLPLR